MNVMTPIGIRQKVGLRAVDYMMLADAGALDAYGRTELIEGEIWTMAPAATWHARTMADLTVDLGNALRASGGSLRVFAAGSVMLTDDSVPEPDISVAEDEFPDRLIPLEALKLAVQISDLTASIDLGVKLRLYARAAVPEYWVVERRKHLVNQFWAPSPTGYAERRTVTFGEEIASATQPSIVIHTPIAA